MGDEVLKKFGRYFLLDRIAQGGMAEIYRARMASLDGAGRLLVIKRVISGYGNNKEFLDMFKSEIKVTLGFSHPNIVQVYDFGDQDNQPYIAMEFIDGRNLRHFASKFAEIGQRIPVDLAAHIIEESAAGLTYAHNFKDKITGDPLDVIHRDISPQNILISFDGNVKVIDFGIAKAATNSELTKAGVIKGKLSYLSPEQISGDELDKRSDIFALGIVLWELLTGKKLFHAPGENEYAVLKQIESCTSHVKPPSTINKDVPRELDAIVLKALSKEKEKRYQDAEEMQRALHKFIAAFSPEFNPTDLGRYAKKLFADFIVDDRKRIKELNQRVESLLAVSAMLDSPDRKIKNEASTPPPVPGPTPATLSSRGKDVDKNEFRKSEKIELDPHSLHKTGMYSMPPTTILPYQGNETVTRKSSTRASSGQKGGRGKFEETSAPKSPRGDGVVDRDFTSATRPASGGGSGIFKGIFALAAAAGIVFSFPFWSAYFDRKEADRSIAAVEIPASHTGHSKSIHVKLNIVPPGTDVQITVNGNKVPATQPYIQIETGETIEIQASRPGFKSIHKEFVLDPAQYAGQSSSTVDLSFEPMNFGLVSIQTTPSSDARIVPIDSRTRAPASAKSWSLSTPVESLKLPPGSYQIRLENKFLDMEKIVVIQVSEGKSVVVNEKLELKKK